MTGPACRPIHLNRFFRLVLSATADVPRSIELLRDVDCIDAVYPVTLASMQVSIRDGEIHGTSRDETPDFSESQDYLFSDAPGAPRIADAWDYEGGKGRSVRLTDIEYGWDRFHEDLEKLRDPAVIIGGDPGSSMEEDHGTAVAGMVIGTDNGFGIIGCVPESDMQLCYVMNEGRVALAEAVVAASDSMRAGDVILIEMQALGPDDGNGHASLVPVEWLPEIFAAIAYATDQGRIVIEPVGNSGTDLDDPIYQSRFDREFWDSGAIVVGAGQPYSSEPCIFSGHGSRVDLQGWGSAIVTTGFGDAPGSPTELHRQYTDRFGGTSGAAAMVAATVVAIQGIAQARFGEHLGPRAMRDLLVRSGTPPPQAGTIGALIDIHAAVGALGEPTPTPTPGIFADLRLNSNMYQAGDLFVLTQETLNSGEGLAVSEYLVLDVLGCFYFWHWPGFDTNFSGRTFFLPPGRYSEQFLNFIWPEGDFGEIDGIGIYFCYLGIFSVECASNLDMCLFGYR